MDVGGVSNGGSLHRRQGKFHTAGGVMMGIAIELEDEQKSLFC